MFSGIIATVGTLAFSSNLQGGRRLVVDCELSFLDGVVHGASIAVNGACQTVEECTAGGFSFFSSMETLECSNLSLLRPGDPCNLEKALTLSDPLDGHIVTGHVDGIGRVLRLEKQGGSRFIEVSLPEPIRPLVATKGSLAVNGISLTVNHAAVDRADLMVIPFTFEQTNLASLRVGDLVNLEADILARYIERRLSIGGKPSLEQLLKENEYCLDWR